MKSAIVEDVGNVDRLWRVEHELFGDIGVAVQQKQLYLMIGEAGIAFFATASSQAFGNFNSCDIGVDKFDNEWVCHPYYKFVCKFNPCCCDTSFKSYRN